MEDSLPPAPVSVVRFAGAESSSQGSVTSHHHNDSKVRASYLKNVFQQNVDIFMAQAGHSLVMFNDSASPEGSVGEQQAKASTPLTA